MFGINLFEFFFLIILFLILVKPRDIPTVFYKIGSFIGIIRGCFFLLQQSLNQFYQGVSKTVQDEKTKQSDKDLNQ